MNTAQKATFVSSKAEVEKILKKLESLPTLPTIVYELNQIINNPLSSAADVSRVMEKDQSIAAKVLKLVNSAYYGIPGGISNLQRAISYLGFDTVNQLVLTATVFKNLNKSSSSTFNLAEFWKHAIGTAMAAETIAKWAKHPSPGDCFSAGLLHDLGKVALYLVAPEYLDKIADVCLQDNLSFLHSEQKSGGVPHTHVGALLASLWKLPSLIENSILYHHEPDIKKRNIIKPEINQIVDTVFLANSIMHELNFGNSGHTQKIEADKNLIARTKINQIQMPLLIKDIERVLTTVDDFLKTIAA